MAKQNLSDGSITAERSDQVSDSSQLKLTPNFNNVLGNLHGFVPEEGGKPKKQNIEAFRDYIFGNVFDNGYGAADSWDEIFSEVERSMVFWRKYFCGLD